MLPGIPSLAVAPVRSEPVDTDEIQPERQTMNFDDTPLGDRPGSVPLIELAVDIDAININKENSS